MASDQEHPRGGFHSGAFLRLAFPMIVSRAGLAVMGIADGVMVARFRSVEFAWLSLAEGTLGRLLDVCVAFLIGGMLLAPRLYAQGDTYGARRVWLRTVPVSLGLGLLGTLAGLCGRPLLLLMGQRAELAEGSARVMAILGAGSPAALVAVAAAVYLEGIQRPKVVAACVVLANALNLALNWMLIGGHLGVVAMGARGSALSTTVMRWVLGLVLGGLAWRSNKGLKTEPAADGDAKTQWRLSFGSAASVGAMIALGSWLIIFAGRLGVLPLAVFSAAWALAAPGVLVTMGMADATGVMVAAEDGKAGRRCAGTVAWACLRLTLGVVGALAMTLALGANTFAGFYASDVAMRRRVGALLPVVALILAMDCVGFVMVSSLRAMREAAWPAAIEVGAMLLLAPIAAALAFLRGLGVEGLFLAMLAAGTIRTGMLVARFLWRTHRSAEWEADPNTPDGPLELVCR